MFKHILVTLDGSPRAESVLAPAFDMARSMSAHVTLLRIVDGPLGGSGEHGGIGRPTGTRPLRSLFSDQAMAYLRRVAQTLRSSGVEADTLVKEGSPAAQILASAAEVGADAIAMCTRSRRGINKLVFGSVAEAVLHQTSIPILLVRSAA